MLKNIYLYSTYSSFLVTNVCNEGNTLCSPGTSLLVSTDRPPFPTVDKIGNKFIFAEFNFDIQVLYERWDDRMFRTEYFIVSEVPILRCILSGM